MVAVWPPVSINVRISMHESVKNATLSRFGVKAFSTISNLKKSRKPNRLKIAWGEIKLNFRIVITEKLK